MNNIKDIIWWEAQDLLKEEVEAYKENAFDAMIRTQEFENSKYEEIFSLYEEGGVLN